MQNIISIKNLTKSFKEGNKKLSVLKDINLEIQEGEFFVILGPSGSGKSTLLRLISGLDKDCEGEIKINKEIQPSDMSFVFQQFALFPWLNVYKNIEIGTLAHNYSPEEREKRIAQELKLFNLEKSKDVYPKELSGGMRQRVGIARAFVSEPKIIFMDEPFSELDSFTAQELRQEFLRIWKEKHQTVIMVTHLIDEAIELADRIAVLTPMPGKIEKIIINNLPRPREKRTPLFWNMEDELNELIKP